MTQITLRDERTIDMGKTREQHLTKVGHPGYGRTKKASLYVTPEIKGLVEKRVELSGYATQNDYINALLIKDLKGDLPAVESEPLASDGPTEEVAPFETIQDPPREEAPLPKAPWQETFWKEVKAITGEGDAWKWLGEGCFPLVEYGQIIELSVQNKMFREIILERELDQCVLLHCLNELGITKQLVIAVRPQAPAKEEAPKPTKPKDAILANIEQDIAIQQSLDPRNQSLAVRAKLSNLWDLYTQRQRELFPKRGSQNHIYEWRKAAGSKGVSAYETTGPATRADKREASKAIKKDYS
jgi:hypothetical protein